MKRLCALVMSAVFVIAGAGHLNVSASSAGVIDPGKNVYKGKDADNVNPKGVFPIVKNKITLEVAMPQNAKVKDYPTNAHTKMLEDKSGISLKFNLIAGDAQAKVKLMFASGDLPDVIMGVNIDSASLLDYGSQGLIQPLNSLISTYGDEVFKMWETAEDKNLKNLMMSSDGNFYSMPKYSEQLINLYNYRSFLYKGWLEKLNMTAAKTTDEYTALLKAFRDKDPNGNGKKDEVPLMGNSQNGAFNGTIFLLNSFIFTDTKDKLIVENGKVDAAFTKPEFRDGLEYMNMLVKEKLLDPITFTQDQNQQKAILAQKELTVGAIMVAAKTAVLDTNSQLSKDFVAQPPLVGPKGVNFSPATPPAVQNVYQITNKCKNPAAAYRLADLMLNDEVTFMARFGMEGADWKKITDPKKIGIGNVPATFDLIVNQWAASTQNQIWSWPNPGFMKYGTMEGLLWNEDPYEYNYYQTKYGVDYIKGKQPKESMPLDLVMTLAEMDKYAVLQPAIKTYLDENITKFIVGDRNLNEWDKFVAEFNKMDLKGFLELMQSAYDRTTGKK